MITSGRTKVRLDINGQVFQADIEPRLLLSDFIRDQAGLTGTNVGCEHGVCGACTVQLDGEPVRSCLILAIQTTGRKVRTIEGLVKDAQPGLHPLQEAFRETHALQCGICTPGFLMLLEAYIRDTDTATRASIREAVSANLCRCTGYQGIVDAVELALERKDEEDA